ncbi:MAG: cysteine desulfurase NifS [Planctomycetota bacterium]|jgi:cysteine desulfurase
MKRIYLDHNATSPIHPDVVEAMLPYLREVFGNPSSIHRFGQEANRGVERAREQVAALLHAEPREIVFTGGGTEADNHAIRGVLDAKGGEGGHIITSAIEHPAVLHTCKEMERRGVPVTFVPVDETGRVDPESVAEAMTEKTRLVSVMLANNEVGTLEPLKEIVERVRRKGVLIHTDAVQALGKVPVDVGELGVDLLSISGHKIHGPKGIGALYIRRGAKIGSLLFGGHHERRRRAGTENVASIVGFGKACEIALQEIDTMPGRIAALRDRLQERITRDIPHVLLNGNADLRLPNTLNMSFAFIEGEALLMNLDAKGIAASTGSACTSGTLEPSHVLTAMGRRPDLAQGSIRFSLGRDNAEEEIDFTVETLAEVVPRLREMSPLYEDFVAGKIGLEGDL